ncbi:TIGR03667 family PPOX class F420-dependent oxidoreductase [Amycolatopsis saalfeldensis]|uniref:PPOX class probable F420-dependent enzyme, Rv3369 family n=1 Tax=Amycolatopsis saalfeldensis TaxID=394193 RepID=A0A1H8YLZ9_9PSEU|nr:TIGR03667 family PPOX class F420-dependent oxidoreductase [Amycolatopsis saalfeldensis]SEP53021.1 PPOX class probable F420-dependent enzyme, Rv3369 family [Amycolatopsis saalfeldensis]
MSYTPDPKLIERAGESIGWLTTVTPKGRPAPRPVWFTLDGDDILVFSQPDTAKLRHIAANPEVSFNFNSDKGGGSILVVNGRAQVEAGKASEAPGYLDKYESTYAGIGYADAAAFDASFSVRIRIVPERSWGF